MQKQFTDNMKHLHETFKDGLSFNQEEINYQCYAIADEGQILKRFELIQGNGKRYSFSYALLPVYIQPDNSVLFIRSHELLIQISGYNIDPIREYLNNEQLLWAKASPSGKSDGTQSTFIGEISIQGNAIITVI